MAIRHLLVAALLALPGALSAQPDCGVKNPQKPTPPDSVAAVERLLAIVGDRYILCSEFWPVYTRRLADQQRSMPDSATVKKELSEMLESYVDAELLVYIALQQDLDIPAEDMERALDEEVNKIRAQFRGNEDEFIKTLREGGFATVESYRRFLGDQFRRQVLPGKLIDKLRREGKLSVSSVADSLIAARLPEYRAARGKKPARVSFKQIFLTTMPTPQAELAAKARADSLLLRLRNGEDFEALAKSSSDDPITAPLGGDLGWKTRNKFYPEFERWVFSAAPGTLSPVIRTPVGYHIGRVDRVQSAEVKSRHILIRPKVDSADAVRNKALADSVVKILRAGQPFDSVADKFGDVTLKAQRNIPSYHRDSLPTEYADAFRDLKVGDITAPFQIPDDRTSMPTYVVAMITAIDPGGEYTDEELREELRRNLQNNTGIRLYLDKMRKQVYVKIFL